MNITAGVRSSYPADRHPAAPRGTTSTSTQNRTTMSLHSDYVTHFHTLDPTPYPLGRADKQFKIAVLRAVWQDHNTGPTPDDETLSTAYYDVPAGVDHDGALTRMISTRPTITFLTPEQGDIAAEPDFPQPDEDDVLLARVQTMVHAGVNEMDQLTLESARVLLADYARADEIHTQRANDAADARTRLLGVIRGTMENAS